MEIAVFDADSQYLYVNPAGVKDEQQRAYIIGKDDFEFATYRKRDNTVPLLRKSQFLKAKVTRRTVSWEDQSINTAWEWRRHICASIFRSIKKTVIFLSS